MAQSLFIVKLQPEGTGSRAVTGNYQCVPRACMGCRLQDDSMGPRVREVQSMSKGVAKEGQLWGDLCWVSGGPGQCWQTQNKHIAREHLCSQELQEEPIGPSRCIRLYGSGVLGSGVEGKRLLDQYPFIGPSRKGV